MTREANLLAQHHTSSPEGLATEMVDLQLLHTDPANARLHDDKNLAAIANSLKHYGQVEPLLVQRSTKKIVGGNGRYQAMSDLGWKKCSVIFLDLNDIEATSLGIALNRSAELGRWDNEVLEKLLAGLQEDFPLEELGFDGQELERLLKDDLDLSNAHLSAEETLQGNLQDDSSAEAAPQHVRQVQLFFDETTHEEFMSICDRMRELHKTQTLSDTVLWAMRNYARLESICPDEGEG